MRRTILLILVLTLAAAGTASASPRDVLRDCTDDGRLQKTYTQQELRGAIATIPSDVDEYTNCRDVIKAAQISGASGGGDTGGGGDASGGTGGSTGGGTGGSTGAGTGGSTGAGTSTGDGAPSDGAGSGATAGSFGGFSGFDKDPMKTATDDEQQAIAAAIADRPPTARRTSAPFADSDLPTPLWIVLGLGAAGIVALAASHLRRRVVARRVA